MTVADLLLQTMDVELAMARRILDRVPTDCPDWAPHVKSMPLGKLAMHVATLPGLATLCLNSDSFNLADSTPPDLTLRSHDQLLGTFDETSGKARAALAAASEEQLSAPWRFSFGERVISDTSRAFTLTHIFLGHLIHHRAQLGTYLRQLDLPVPGVYGPSADDQLARA